MPVTDHEWIPEQYVTKPAPLKVMSAFEHGFQCGANARTSGRYSPGQIRSMLEQNASSKARWTLGYCAGLRGDNV